MTRAIHSQTPCAACASPGQSSSTPSSARRGDRLQPRFQARIRSSPRPLPPRAARAAGLFAIVTRKPLDHRRKSWHIMPRKSRRRGGRSRRRREAPLPSKSVALDIVLPLWSRRPRAEDADLKKGNSHGRKSNPKEAPARARPQGTKSRQGIPPRGAQGSQRRTRWRAGRGSGHRRHRSRTATPGRGVLTLEAPSRASREPVQYRQARRTSYESRLEL